MGQAFDRDGRVLGEAEGATMREVFEKLHAQHKDAAEIRIKSADERAARPELERMAAALRAKGESEDAVALGRSLHGKFVRFLDESKVSRGYLVTHVTEDGMLEIRGHVGQFAPHLFERVDHPHSAAEGNC